MSPNHLVTRLSAPFMNPVLVKGLRSQMRGARAFAILTGSLLLLSGVAFVPFKSVEQMVGMGGGPLPASTIAGVTLFLGLSLLRDDADPRWPPALWPRLRAARADKLIRLTLLNPDEAVQATGVSALKAYPGVSEIFELEGALEAASVGDDAALSGLLRHLVQHAIPLLRGSGQRPRGDLPHRHQG